MSLYNDLSTVLTPYANKIKRNESDISAIKADLSESAGDLKSAFSDQNKYVIGKENLILGATWTDGSQIASDGTITESVYYRYSSLIEIPNGEYIFYGKGKGSSVTTRIHGYDANGDWVKLLGYSSSGSDTFAKEIVFPVSANIKYIRISAGKEAYYIPEFLGYGDSVQSMIESTNASLGEWYKTKEISGSQYPYIQILTTGSAIKLYVKIVDPNPNSVTIYGSNDLYATQTAIHSSTKSEFIADIPSGYTSLRITVNLSSSYTGTYRAIIHTVDDHSVSQKVLDLQDDVKSVENQFASSIYVPKEAMTGTDYEGFYLNTAPYQGISSINNTAFHIVTYPIEEGKTYYLIGKSVAIAASLPVACYGTAEVVAKNSYIEKILDGSSTAQDYSQRYIAPGNGYIYIATYSTNNVIRVFDSQTIADAYMDGDTAKEKLNITIQLFGDSITDDKWGDHSTWADYIPDNLSDYNVTVYNEAVGGSGIGHGKSTSTESHQSDTYNYVYDLVTDGTTLKASANYIVILIGTNNWDSGFDVGDMTSTGYHTIYGSLKGILEYISEHSAATVFVCTIPQRYNTSDQGKSTNANGEPINADNVSLADYCEPFKKLPAFYGMPCIDLNAELGWNRDNISNFTSDGLHPNGKGDKMLSALICSKIREHIGNVAY